MSDPSLATARPRWVPDAAMLGPVGNADKIAAFIAPDTRYPEFWPGSRAAILSTDLCNRPARKLTTPPFPPVIVRGSGNMDKDVRAAVVHWTHKYKWQCMGIFPTKFVPWTIEDVFDDEEIHVQGKKFCEAVLELIKLMSWNESNWMSESYIAKYPDRMPQFFNAFSSNDYPFDPQRDFAIVDQVFTVSERQDLPRIFLWHIAALTWTTLRNDHMRMVSPLTSTKQLPTLTEHQENPTVAADTAASGTTATVVAYPRTHMPADAQASLTVEENFPPHKTEAPASVDAVAHPSNSATTTLTQATAPTPAYTTALALKASETTASKAIRQNSPKEGESSVPTNVDTEAVLSLLSLSNTATEPTSRKINRKVRRKHPGKLKVPTEKSPPTSTPAIAATAPSASSDHTPIQAATMVHQSQPMSPSEPTSSHVGQTTKGSEVGHITNPPNSVAPKVKPRHRSSSAANQPRNPPTQGENVDRVPSGPHSHQTPGPAASIQPSPFIGNSVPVGPPWMMPPQPGTLVHYGPGPAMIPLPGMPPGQFIPMPGQVVQYNNQPQQTFYGLYGNRLPHQPRQVVQPQQKFYGLYGNALPSQPQQAVQPQQGVQSQQGVQPQQPVYGPYGLPLLNAGFFAAPLDYADARTGNPHQAANFNAGSSHNASKGHFDSHKNNNRRSSDLASNTGGNRYVQGGVEDPAHRSRKTSNASIPHSRTRLGETWRHSAYPEDDPSITADHQFGCHHTWIGPENETVRELFIGDLPENVVEYEISHLFIQTIGITPSRVDIKPPRDGVQNRWHAFAGFSSTADAKKALRIRDQSPAIHGRTIKVMVPKTYFSKHPNSNRGPSVTSGTKASASKDDDQKHLYSPQDARSDLQKTDGWKGKETARTPIQSGSPEAHRSGRQQLSPMKKKGVKINQTNSTKPGQSLTTEPTEPAKSTKATRKMILKPPRDTENASGSANDVESEVRSLADSSVTVKPTPSGEAVTTATTSAPGEIASDAESKNDQSFHTAKESLTDNVGMPMKVAAIIPPEDEVAAVPSEPVMQSQPEPLRNGVEKVETAKPTTEITPEPVNQPQSQLHHSSADEADKGKSASETVTDSAIQGKVQPEKSKVKDVEPAKTISELTTEPNAENTKITTAQSSITTSASSASTEKLVTTSTQVMKPMASLATPGAQQTESLSPFAKPSKAQQKKEKEARKKQQRKEAEEAKATSSKSVEESSMKATGEHSNKGKKPASLTLSTLKQQAHKESLPTVPSDTCSIASSITLQDDDTALMSPSPPRDGYVTALQTPMFPGPNPRAPEPRVSPRASPKASLEGFSSKASPKESPKVSPETTIPSSEVQAAYTDSLQVEAPKKKKKKNKKKSKKTNDAEAQATSATGTTGNVGTEPPMATQPVNVRTTPATGKAENIDTGIPMDDHRVAITTSTPETY